MKKNIRKRIRSFKDVISDEAFFLSREFIKTFTQRLNNMALNYNTKETFKINIYNDPTDSKIAFTNGSTVYINLSCDFIQDEKLRYNKYLIIRGLALHELGHILYSDFRMMRVQAETFLSQSLMLPQCFPQSEAVKKMNSKLSKLTNKKVKQLFYKEIQGNLQNILEDAHVNERSTLRYPGEGECLNSVLKRMWQTKTTYEELKKALDDRKAANEIDELMKDYFLVSELIHQYAIYGQLKAEPSVDNHHYDYLSEAMPFIDEMIFCNHARKRMSLQVEVLAIIFPLLEGLVDYLISIQDDLDATDEALDQLAEAIADAIDQSSEQTEGRNTAPGSSAQGEANGNEGKNIASSSREMSELEKKVAEKLAEKQKNKEAQGNDSEESTDEEGDENASSSNTTSSGNSGNNTEEKSSKDGSEEDSSGEDSSGKGSSEGEGSEENSSKGNGSKENDSEESDTGNNSEDSGTGNDSEDSEEGDDSGKGNEDSPKDGEDSGKESEDKKEGEGDAGRESEKEDDSEGDGNGKGSEDTDEGDSSDSGDSSKDKNAQGSGNTDVNGQQNSTHGASKEEEVDDQDNFTKTGSGDSSKSKISNIKKRKSATLQDEDYGSQRNERKPISEKQESKEESSKILDTILDKMAERFSEEQAELEYAEELNDQIQAMDHSSRFNNLNYEVHRTARIDQEHIDNYNEVYKKHKFTINRMISEFKKVIIKKEKGEYMKNLYMGNRLEAGKLIRRDGKVFTKKKLPTNKPTLSVALLIDESGSMGGQRIAAAREGALMLYEFCTGLNIPCTVFGHTTSGWSNNVLIDSIADFKVIDKNNKYRIMTMEAGGGNNDAHALRYVAERSHRESNADTKLLIILSDGQPNGGIKACEDIKYVINHYANKKIQIFGAAIAPDAVPIKAIYGDRFLDMTKLDKLPKDLVNLVKPYIK
ncbi:uncharacterized protein YoxC/DNA-binding TFAR19-related protein (PDSD5 family) [Lachnospiraceae bacterium PF1-22]